MQIPSEITRVLNDLDASRAGYYTDLDVLAAAHNTWDRQTDARLTVFATCGNVVSNAQIGMLFWVHDLSDKNWWNHVGITFSDEAYDHHLREFHVFIKQGLIQIMTSAIESCMRAIVRILSPGACNDGNAEFKSIYDHLLAHTGLAAKWGDLLELLRLVRNTIHNNSLYMPRSGRPVTVTYKGTLYEFEVGKYLNIITWDFLLMVVNDLRAFLNDLITRLEIEALPRIEDPLAVLLI